MAFFSALFRKRRPEVVTAPAVPAQILDFSVELEPGFGHDRVHVTLSIPALPPTARDVRFMEHEIDRANGRVVTDRIIAAARGGVVVSDDLGRDWRHQPIPGLTDFRIRNIFTTSEGLHLLQEGEAPGDGDRMRLALCDAEWNLVDM